MKYSLFLAIFVLLLLIFALASTGLAQTQETETSFAVDSTVDAIDANPGDGVCATEEEQCTLRAAIMEANALPGTDTIVLPSGIYTLTIPGMLEDAAVTGDLDIASDIVLAGTSASNTIVDGGQIDRVFHVVTESAVVSISNLTMRNGATGDDSHPGEGAGLFNAGVLFLDNVNIVKNAALSCTGPNSTRGGGIFNQGVFTITDSIIAENIAHREQGFTSGEGGGIYNEGLLNPGIGTVINTTIISNTAGSGGGVYNWGGDITCNNVEISDNTSQGIWNQSAATLIRTKIVNNSASGIFSAGILTVTHSAIISNTSSNSGGGVIVPCCSPYTATLTNSTISGNRTAEGYNGGGIYFMSPSGLLSLNNVSIVNNVASGSGDGGGVYNYAALGTVRVKNSIIAQNIAQQAPDCYWIEDSQGYNLIGDSSDCAFVSTTGDLVGTAESPIDPLLGPLQDNGGNTLTYALLGGSPAIDRGNPSGCTDGLGTILTTDQRYSPRPIDGDQNGSQICDIGAYELWEPTDWMYLPIILR